ncbi:hypothetical protein D3C79_971790 [compost metagenome]
MVVPSMTDTLLDGSPVLSSSTAPSGPISIKPTPWAAPAPAVLASTEVLLPTVVPLNDTAAVACTVESQSTSLISKLSGWFAGASAVELNAAVRT